MNYSQRQAAKKDKTLKIQQVQFITSALTIRHAPPDSVYPEIAVMGASNVGKSSFICSLTGRKGIAKTSSTPGKTRLINYFLIDNSWYLVDLPGYGFAKVSKKMQESWGHSMEEYLLERQGIKLAILLADARHGMKKNDLQMFAWLAERHYPTQLILTKTDKQSRSKNEAMLKECSATLGIPADEIILYSSETHAGRDETLKCLAEVIKAR